MLAFRFSRGLRPARPFVPCVTGCTAALLAIAALLSTAGVARASEESERLASRGLVAFHAESYTEALQLFERAVQADSNDTYALYYRGVTRARLADYAGAITDLQAVIARKVALQQAPLELGVAMVQAGQYRDAVPWLEQAQKIAHVEARASLFLGIAQLRMGDTTAAARNFARAAQSPPVRLAARYYQGVVAYQQGNWLQSEEYFAYVDATSPDSEMGHEAAQFLLKIRQTKRPTAEVYGGVGFQYDSNVIIAPSNDADANEALTELGISRQSDESAVVLVGGTYAPWRTDIAEVSVGYEFYQSLHFKLNQFNIQDHRPRAQVFVNAGPVQIGLEGRYDYYFLDTDSFLSEVNGLPWVEIPEAEFGRAEVYYRIRHRDFVKQQYSLRNGLNNAVGGRQFFFLGAPDRYASIGYQFDNEDPSKSSIDAEKFGYDGNQVAVGVGWTLPAAVAAEATFTYRNEQYAGVSANFPPQDNGRRTDNDYEFVVALRRPINEFLGVTLAYDGTINNSNKTEFDYTRHIVSIGVDARFH